MPVPKLPASIHSSLGAIPVSIKANLKTYDGVFEALGMYHKLLRTIELNPECTPALLWTVLFHEITHAALYDSGAENVLDDKQVEVVCDALGLFLGNMVIAGQLTLRTVKEGK